MLDNTPRGICRGSIWPLGVFRFTKFVFLSVFWRGSCCSFAREEGVYGRRWGGKGVLTFRVTSQGGWMRVYLLRNPALVAIIYIFRFFINPLSQSF